MKYVIEATADIVSKAQALAIDGRIHGPDFDPLAIPGIALLSDFTAPGTATPKAEFVGGEWRRVYNPLTPSQMNEIAKGEAAKRIVAVVDLTAQLNLNAAMNAGTLSAEDQATFALGVQWIDQVRAAWPVLVSTHFDPDPQVVALDIYDDANWPVIPAGVADLGSRF